MIGSGNFLYMRTPRKPKETRQEKRGREQAERAAQKAAYVRAKPNPFVEWPEYSVAMVEVVTDALDRSGLQPTWQKEKKRKQKPLTARELAIAYWAVICKSENTKNRGCNYGELKKCFYVCNGRECHRNQCPALFRALIELDLIRHVKLYSTASGAGNVYERMPEGQTNRGQPRKRAARPKAIVEPPTPPDLNADPF